MIHYLYGDQIANNPHLFQTMFEDRAAQFGTRLNWQVTIDASGQERDQYDLLNPLYVIWQAEDGGHGGSMRFLPTTGRIMVNEHFQHLTDNVTIQSPLIWECTRFCISPRHQQPETAARLMLAGAELGRQFHLSHSVGVFDTVMTRVYNSLGWSPDILGTDGKGRAAISVGLWDFKAAPFATLAKSAKVEDAASMHWFQQSFNRFGKAQRTC